ncbi:MAG: glycerate kinase, partial [Chloroflexota bacterium]|nr:glycerate kinase [Chloroflexota bacterium]
MARIVVAPQAFKGSLSAVEVASAMAEGVRRSGGGAEVVQLPMADGGEGTVDALLVALGGERRQETVEGPLGKPVQSTWALLPDGRAAVEMAAASGLTLLPPHRRDPRRTSTYGTGQLIRAALGAGPTEIIVGLGGSATNDAGAGALQALGMRLLNETGQELGRGGAALTQLARIDPGRLDP